MNDLAITTTVNEADTIVSLVSGLRSRGLDVLVVDAGSTDGTADLALAAGAHVLRMPRISIRDALLAGWEMALEDAWVSWVVQIDAGGSHMQADADRLLYVLKASGADMAIGSRFMSGSVYRGRPLRREMSKLAAAACRLRTGVCITDWTSGLRAFSRPTLSRLVQASYRATMHGWQIEVLGEALRQGLRVVEAPITYHAGRSSFGWRVALEALGTWARL